LTRTESRRSPSWPVCGGDLSISSTDSKALNRPRSVQLRKIRLANDIAKMPPPAFPPGVRGTATVGLVIGKTGRITDASPWRAACVEQGCRRGCSYDGVSLLLGSGQAGGSEDGLGIQCPIIRSMRLKCTAAEALPLPNFQLALCTIVLFPPKSLSLNHLGPKKSSSSL
jgi:hypothetical protein